MVGLYRERPLNDWTGSQNDYAHEHAHDELLPALETIEAALDSSEALAALDQVRAALRLARQDVARRIAQLEAERYLLQNPGTCWNGRHWVPRQSDPERLEHVERELARLRGEREGVAA